MIKLVCGLFAALLFAACGSIGPGNTGPGGSVPMNSLPGANDAQAQLCSSTTDASLSGLATDLNNFDPQRMDPTDFQVAAGAVAANLAQLQVTGDQATLRDAAVTAIGQIQGTQVDKTTATQAAAALSALEQAIC